MAALHSHAARRGLAQHAGAHGRRGGLFIHRAHPNLSGGAAKGSKSVVLPLGRPRSIA
jgi:hypothetical protein